ncbi:MAG: class I SAM-dependent methyltransferase [Desulfobulbaceae bacterium]|nr:class I SAM-dependent methyltransferase [Desulfobulbaceae bacterium]
MTVQELFDRYAADYDAARRRLIPCFDDFYGSALAVIPFAKAARIKVLDLGAGTGLLAAMVAAAYPEAELTLVDISEKMLAEAAKRFAALARPAKFMIANYANQLDFKEDFDLVISALSIHHLAEQQKINLCGQVYKALAPGGFFVNADQVLGETARIEAIYRETWLRQVTKGGATEEELAAALARMTEDKMSTLALQLAGLKKSGFANVNCWYKNYSFVVYSGEKAK